jgi:hypothetical protein
MPYSHAYLDFQAIRMKVPSKDTLQIKDRRQRSKIRCNIPLLYGLGVPFHAATEWALSIVGYQAPAAHHGIVKACTDH